MNIELKKISHNARLSQETAAYAAEIWVNGVRRGTVDNSGQGGPDNVQPHSLAVELEAYAKTLPKVSLYGEEFEQSTELVLGALLDRHNAAKRLARMLKTKTVFTRAGKVYTIKTRPAVLKPGSVILNDMPIDAAVAAFLACE